MNGNGKEYYNNGTLKFEGEYLNGKEWNVKGYKMSEIKNGKGLIKEYEDYGRCVFGLKFEGEYLNGERNGKGREYYKGGELIFEGEYLNGKKWNGKGYNNRNEIIYELKNGKGFTKEYNHYGYLIFEGEYLNGERNGKGKEYFGGRLYFEGEYLNGKKWMEWALM